MEYIDGKAVIEQYSISVGELVKAILDGLPAYNAVTGKRVIDQDMMIACPKYETEEQAAKAVDYVDNMLAATRLSLGMPPFRDYSHSGAGYIDAVVRKDRIQGFLKDCKSYKFPEGYDRPQEPCVFPLRYDTFHREYADAVHLKMHGENETVIGLYQKLIGAMRLPVAAVEERFRKASSATGFDIRRVPLTPGQDFMGSPMEKALDRPISLYDLLCKLERAKHKPKFPLSEEFISKQVRAGGLHVYEPPQDRWGYWYTPFGKGAKEIEVLFAAAELGGWTDVAALSALFVDMAEVEANAELNKVLKPAVEVVTNHFGVKPLIVPVVPINSEREPAWSWYSSAMECDVQRNMIPYYAKANISK
jgi:hypothetical protein